MGFVVTQLTVRDRLASFRSALAAAGVPFDPSLVVTHERFGRGEAIEVARLLERDDAPTALLCATSLAAIGTVRAIRSRGLRMPALISFGDFTLAEVLDPGITYVDHDPRLLASAAFRLLRERAVRPDEGPERVIVPTRLVPRGSGEMQAAGASDAVVASAMGPSTGSGTSAALAGSGAVAASADSRTTAASAGGPGPTPLPALAGPATALVATALSLVHPEPAGDAAVPAAAPIGAP